MKTLRFTSLLNRVQYIPRIALAYVLVLIVLMIFFIPCLMLMCLPEKYRRDNKVLFWFLGKTLQGIVWASLMKVHIHGKKNLHQETASIFIANHESSLDIPLLGSLAGSHPQVWFALDFYLKFPVLGFVIKRLAIPVARGDAQRAARALVTGIRLLEGHNRHLMIFPEGGRFVDGKIHDFFPGFSFLAERTGRQVIPVYIHNAGKVLPPDSFIPHYEHPITMIIGEPFYIHAQETGEDFNKRVHTWFVKQAETFHVHKK